MFTPSSKKISIRFFLILAIAFMVSCSKKSDQQDYYVNKPVAGFTYTGNDGPAPVSIQFHNTSENTDQYEWDFGDGYTSTDKDPSHTYHNSTNDVRTFLVVLKATDSSSGLFQRISKSIAIQPGG